MSSYLQTKEVFNKSPLLLIILSITLCSWNLVLAQADCGSIIRDFGEFGGLQPEPIVNCDNPFNKTVNPSVAAEFSTTGRVIFENDIIQVASTTIMVPITVRFWGG